MMGRLVVHDAQAGGFSPISIYETITNSVMRDNDLPVGELTVFLTSLFVNLAIAGVLFVVLGGRELMSRRIDAGERDETGHDGSGRPGPVSTVSEGDRAVGSGTATRAAATSTAQKVAVDQAAPSWRS